MRLLGSCGWDCHYFTVYYFNSIVPCHVSASCIHQVGQLVLPGQTRYMEIVQSLADGDLRSVAEQGTKLLPRNEVQLFAFPMQPCLR